MTEISKDHLEWAVVDRLRQMLNGVHNNEFNVTQTYSLFTSILCWTMQHIRIKSHEIRGKKDKVAHSLWKKLESTLIIDDSWLIHNTDRIFCARMMSIQVPSPRGFEDHNAARFLTNLRDATAHGDSRNIMPFNKDNLLIGFTFFCAEFKDRKQVWDGEITLLEDDMRRIGNLLAGYYCDALRDSKPRRRDGSFERNAALIKEVAA